MEPRTGVISSAGGSPQGQQAAQWAAIEGERKQVTVLFADVVGSTAMAEQLDPEQVAEIMNGAFAVMNAAVDRYGGTVARLMGDAILAFFGAPVAHEDDAERAVRAGLEMQREAQAYARAVEQSYGVEFAVRVGINTGLAVLAFVGDQLKTEYTAMGDTTNVASRLQSAAEPGTVLISADTYHLLRGLFEVAPHGAIEVKGKSAPIETYEVLAPKAVPGKVRGLEGLSSPLVGRDAELEVLSGRLAGLTSGRGAVVALLGEAGLGKSRLVAELRSLATAQDPPPRWLEGRALSYGQAIAYYPWRQLLRQALGVQEGDAPAVVRDRLAQGTCTCCSVPGGDLPFLETLLAVESDASLKTVAGLDGDALVRHLTEATRGCVYGLTHSGPVVLVFDDLHWADQASLDLLQNVCELVTEWPLLIVCVLRPDKGAPSWSFVEQARARVGDAYTELHLEPLPAEQARELLGNLLHIEDLPDGIRGLILRKSEGNPFFLEEVLRSLIDSRHIVREDGHWRATREIANVAIPDTLAGVLSARIDRLPEDTKRVAQTAAVLGRIFAHQALKLVCETAPPPERITDLDPHLGTLTYEELVRERAHSPDLEYIFKHALTQEAAYDSLLLRRRKEYHRRSGDVLEQLYSERLDELAPTLALHFWLGEDWPRAADYATRAGGRAAAVYAMAESLEHYQRAVQALEKLPDPPPIQLIDTTIAWVQVLPKADLPARRAEILQRLARAEDFARRQNDRPRLAQVLSWTANVQILSGFSSAAMEALVESHELAEELGDERLSLLPNFRSVEGLADNDPRAALPRLEHVIELARKYGNRDIEAYTVAQKAMAHAHLGEFEQAREALEQAFAAAAGSKSTIIDADVDLLASVVFFDMGDLERGLEFGRRGTHKATAIGSVECACAGHFITGIGSLQTQNISEALTAFEEAAKLGRASGIDLLLNRGRGGLAIARFVNGETEDLGALEQARANALALDDLYGAAFFSAALGEGYLLLGELEQAEASLNQALDYYRRSAMRPYVARTLQAMAGVYERQGRSPNAERARAEAERLTGELHAATA